MRDECISAVTRAAAAAGKTLTSADLKNIEGRILQAVRDNARDDRTGTAAMTPTERIQAAARRVAAELVEEKKRDAINVARQVIATSRNLKFIEDLAQKGISRMEALRRLDVTALDNKANVASLEQVRIGIANEANRKMGPVVDATSKYLGFWTDKKSVRDVLRELYGEDSGNATAKEAARVWRDQVAEPLRKQFNEVGGAIRKLKDWAIPQQHSQLKVANAGPEKWTNDILPKLDRDAYVNEDGSLMNDVQIRDMLLRVWRTIATDGASNVSPGEHRGSGSVKNRGDDRRVLHFATADDYMDYQASYGEKSLLETMTSHIDSQARNIATLQVYGPNAEAGYRYLLDHAYKAEVEGNPSLLSKLNSERRKTEITHDVATGKIGQVANPVIAKAFATARMAMILGRLGSAALSAVTDGANMSMVARVWGIPQWKRYMYEMKALTSKSFRDDIRTQGAGVEAIAHAISRFGEETFGHGMPSNVANTLLRVSGLNWLDNARRTGSGAMLMDKLGEMSRRFKTMDAMSTDDNSVLLSRGVKPEHYEVWKRADLSNGLLTADGIARIPDEKLSDLGNPEKLRRDAMQSLIGVISSDVNTIVPMMTDKARASVSVHIKTDRGTLGGELVNSMLQFKSFPIAMISNHWQRVQSMPTMKGKVLYAAEHIATSAIMGALVVQLKSLASGNNPQDMTNWKFSARAMVAGGALGLYGDTILNWAATPYRQNIADQLGPLFTTLNDVYNIGQAAYRSTDETKRSDLPGELIKFAKSNTPFANLWYTKAVTDHLIFQALQDYFSPGYSERANQRAVTEFGNAPYWPRATGDTLGTLQSFETLQPPDLSSAFGRQQ